MYTCTYVYTSDLVRPGLLKIGRKYISYTSTGGEVLFFGMMSYKDNITYTV